jgi:hypothetical protein
VGGYVVHPWWAAGPDHHNPLVHHSLTTKVFSRHNLLVPSRRGGFLLATDPVYISPANVSRGDTKIFLGVAHVVYNL